MAFNITNNIITQTGTDTELAGLSSIDGVTTSTLGVGDGQIKVYYLNNRYLNIQGTLTHNPKKEKIVMRIDELASSSANSYIRILGTYNYGEVGGGIGEGLAFTTRTHDHWQSYMIKIESNGIFNWNSGSVIGENVAVYAVGTGVLNILDGSVFARIGSNYGTQNVGGWFGAAATATFNSTKLDVAGKISVKGGGKTLNGITVKNNAVFQITGETIVNAKVDDVNNIIAQAWDNSAKFVNFQHGTNAFVQNGGIGAMNITAEFYKAVNFKILDVNQNNIENAKIYVKDKNNGNRQDFTLKNGNNALNDSIYNFTTNSQGELNSDQEVLLGYVRKSSGDEFIPYDNSLGRYDRRSNNDIQGSHNNLDEFTFHFWSYLHNYKFVIVSLTGTETLVIKDTLLPDTAITETNTTTVNAYTNLETSEKLYDYAKLYKYNNLTINQIDQLLLTRVNDTIYSNYNITIDKTATNVLSFANSTVTIKADVFTDNITLPNDKEVTLLNSAAITGIVLDKNGDSVVKFAGVDSWTLYANIEDRNTASNPIATGTTLYRYTFSTASTFYFRINVEGEVMFKDIQVLKSGITEVSLSSDQILKSLAATVSDVDNKIDIQSSKINDIKTQTDKFTFTANNVNAIAKVIDDKTGYTLTTTDKTAIAVAVESAILDENDSRKVVNAIVAAIGNTNIDEASLVAAVRADLERVGGAIKTIPTNPLLTTDLRLNNLDAKISLAKNTEGEIKAAIIALDQIEKNKFKATIPAEIDTNVKKINGTVVTNIADFKNTVAEIQNAIKALSQEEKDKFGAIIQNEFNTLMNDLPAATKDKFKNQDKTGYSLTDNDKNDIATWVESVIINENDANKVLQAIVDAIGNENISAQTIANAVWNAQKRSLSAEITAQKKLGITF